jgi:hypothetical protein
MGEPPSPCEVARANPALGGRDQIDAPR